MVTVNSPEPFKLVFFDWTTAKDYLSHRVNFTEPLFVVVIMTLAATRPILRLSELLMQKVANPMGDRSQPGGLRS